MTEPWVKHIHAIRALQGRPLAGVGEGTLHDAAYAVLRVAPVGLRLYWLHPAQGLVALSGLRTLGFGWVAPMEA